MRCAGEEASWWGPQWLNCDYGAFDECGLTEAGGFIDYESNKWACRFVWLYVISVWFIKTLLLCFPSDEESHSFCLPLLSFFSFFFFAFSFLSFYFKNGSKDLAAQKGKDHNYDQECLLDHLWLTCIRTHFFPRFVLLMFINLTDPD